ncbi:MAG: C/D box methylation guide ribonucleoprotein complex aNOP56 subunit [Candidatus Hydrothermarchaeales archaeon]
MVLNHSEIVYDLLEHCLNICTAKNDFMKAYIAKSVLGVFAFDENGDLLDSVAFAKNPEEVADKLAKSDYALIPEEEDIMERLKDFEIIIEKEVPIKGISIENPNLGGELLRSNILDFAADLGFSDQEFRKFSHQVNILLTKKKVKEEYKERDKLLAQAIEALDDIDESLNLLSERIREWYSIHFPEMDSAVDDNEKYTGLIQKFGKKENFEGELSTIVKDSMEADIGEEDLLILKGFANRIEGLFKFRAELERYIDSSMEDIAPNLRALIGASLGARLISDAGGLQDLSRMPASRIQVLGAKKALFAHLKKKGSSPKHGVIFQHGTISKSPWWQRGKIARALSSKIAIASRVDAFSGEFVGDRLKEDFLKRFEEIKKAFPNAPKKMRIIRASKRKKR